MNDSSNVSTGKPKVGGAIFVAPKGTAVPTDATTALAGTFVNLGYVSEDGLTNTIATDTNDIKAWGGSTVLTEQTSYKETFSFGLIETKEASVAAYYGAENVEVDGSGNLTIHHNSKTLEESVAVVETVLSDGRVKRTVIPHAKMSDRSGDVTYTDGDPVTYPIVWDTTPDTNGDTAIDYIAAVEESI